MLVINFLTQLLMTDNCVD